MLPTKYLKTLLTPLTKSQCNILNTDDFFQKIKSDKIPEWFKMILFDVNVPLDQTTEMILSKFYQKKKIKTSTPKNILKELLYVCSKEVPFMFNDKIYIQNVVVAMYYPVGSLFENNLWRHFKKKSYQRVIWRDVLMTHTLMLIPKKVELIFAKLN